MEVLLSMMSQGSNLARVTAKAAFGLTCEHTTPDSLKFITEEDFEDVEEDENTCGNEKCMDKSCCEGDKNEDIDENEDEIESSSEEEEEEEDVEEEEEEEEGQVDDTFRDAVRTALGDAAVKNDDDDNEDDSDDDLSDSEMFKFDEALAAVFRDMQRGKNKTKAEMKRQLNTFKIRVLDLVEVLVKSQPKGDLIMDLIFPLLRLMMSQEKDKDQRQIGHKAENVLKMLYKKAEVCNVSLIILFYF
ncbi:hypothetical protein FSP39_020621 [Pinctada imbricata]|uniref:Uncharacterized protein n=1 Tax=Pinctada imbricata TaxID=66713 RepID=A0AA89BV64_PINIB|nr:hypothetical protein FSP39_020621 [Pinctada imbricata]